MKLRNIVSAFAFALALGSAFASEIFVEPRAFTRKADVPLQSEDCEEHGSCPGGTVDCLVTFPIGGTLYQNIPAFDGSIKSETSCGVPLKMNP